jgi:hypothetical protein
MRVETAANNSNQTEQSKSNVLFFFRLCGYGRRWDVTGRRYRGSTNGSKS